ncbi:LuxR C-terminal-related transcriptional regulator [Patulibacter brassicae]|uniref:LuxR C-terminal-related transcriptional regulator n=1 Tax=Patulibacter brassicae TaxID=1705717 RepID=A0ABU4VKT3_9ACTN|nr:LuxR C-terminal-related transcriptional regulator [Patulibacter brassicae]MDX8152408.1 LuxR C-terminal-related transcriptional regulator [Patulibacter brassicae]
MSGLGAADVPENRSGRVRDASSDPGAPRGDARTADGATAPRLRLLGGAAPGSPVARVNAVVAGALGALERDPAAPAEDEEVAAAMLLVASSLAREAARLAGTVAAAEPAAPTKPGPMRHVAPGSPLSRAEHRVLRALDSDRTLAQIGEELYLTRNTVKSHVRRIYRRLGATTRAEALAVARAAGLLEPPRRPRP